MPRNVARAQLTVCAAGAFIEYAAGVLIAFERYIDIGRKEDL